MHKFKIIISIALLSITFIVGYFIGALNYEVPPLKKMDGVKEAKLYDNEFSEDHYVGQIEGNELWELLQNAYWSSGLSINKGCYNFLLSNGMKIRISYYGNFFWIDGVKGHFKLKGDQAKELNVKIENIFRKELLPWRQKRMQNK